VKAAYQGVPGAFSHEACLAFFPGGEAFGKATFAAVIAAVAEQEADVGILPFENSSVGPVEEVQTLLVGCPLPVVARRSLPIRLHLLGLPGADLGQVTTVISHPMALKQCAATLAELRLISRPASNTAVAAQALADPNHAVLASKAAAEAYGLTVLRRDMHDRPDNNTTFVILARVPW
jgi:prephenate dehydratase